MKPSVAIEAGGKVYSLRFTMNSLGMMEDLTGNSLGDVLAKLRSKNMDMRNIRGLMWAALKPGRDDITMLQAGDLIDEIGFEKSLGKLTEVVDLFFSGESKNADAPAKIKNS